MGRYYTGDIEGKFWFGVQSSDASERFGGERWEPSSIDYSFSKEDLPKVRSELKKIEKTLGRYRQKLDEFFDKNDSYNDEMLQKEFNIPIGKVRSLLSDYADHRLGSKILKCLEENGECNFNAEL